MKWFDLGLRVRKQQAWGLKYGFVALKSQHFIYIELL